MREGLLRVVAHAPAERLSLGVTALLVNTIFVALSVLCLCLAAVATARRAASLLWRR
jgi:hypothetical protein